MNSRSRWLFGAVALSMIAVSAPYADENLIVEPLNTPLVFGALQELIVAPKVQRPETICGKPNGSPTNLVDCYEFVATYVSYALDGAQILHLPECNKVPADDIDCEDPANNLCYGNLGLDPLQVKAPVCGDLRIEVAPLTTDEPLTFGQQTTASWDGLSVTSGYANIYVATLKNSVYSGNPYSLPVIRIPASALHHLFYDPTTTLSLVSATHTTGNTFQTGFLNLINRMLMINQYLGSVSNTIPVPVFFGTCC